jgi:hypothetical protein
MDPRPSPGVRFGVVEMVLVGVLVSMLALLSLPSVSAFPAGYERVTANARPSRR